MKAVDHRRNPDGNQNYDITRIWEHHSEVIRLLSLGWKAIDVAAELGIHPQTVSNIRNNPLAQAKIRELQGARDDEAASILKRVRQMAPQALDVLGISLDTAEQNPTDLDAAKEGIKSARTILEHAIPKRIEGKIVHGHITYSQVEKMKDAVKKAAASAAEVAEVAEVTDG